MKKRYWISVTRTWPSVQDLGSIDWKGDACYDFDNFMFFASKKEAEEYIKIHCGEWYGECRFDIVEENEEENEE